LPMVSVEYATGFLDNSRTGIVIDIWHVRQERIPYGNLTLHFDGITQIILINTLQCESLVR